MQKTLVAKVAIEGDFEWVLGIEQDNVLPVDAFFKINEYMKEKKQRTE